MLTVARAGVAGPEDQQILRQLVQSVALAGQALRSYADEHLVALTLQRSFLPVALPEIPGLAMSYRYMPASDQVEVGGDFYEALPWQGKVLVAIGDVQGHSLHAATVMGELRHALRAFAVEDHSPLAITGLVNEVLRRYHPGIIATLCLALVDPASGDLQVVNCGHMPLLLVTGTSATYLGEGGLLLGLPMHEPHVETAFLPMGGTVLLMTDGLVEERSVFLDANLEKLRVAAQEVQAAGIEAFSNHLTSIFGPREDDVAMIALRRIPVTEVAEGLVDERSVSSGPAAPSRSPSSRPGTPRCGRRPGPGAPSPRTCWMPRSPSSRGPSTCSGRPRPRRTAPPGGRPSRVSPRAATTPSAACSARRSRTPRSRCSCSPGTAPSSGSTGRRAT